MEEDEKALSHAWSYFALHANQRITVFNYFVIFSGVLCTGVVAAIRSSPKQELLGAMLGILLVVLSFVFWKIDQRTVFLIKHAEDVIKTIEPEAAKLIALEEQKTANAKLTSGMWSYGDAFGFIFVTMAVIGAAGAALCGLTAFGVLDLTDAGNCSGFTISATP